MLDAGPSHLTLSQLQGMIKETLSGEFPGGVWVVAEIGEMKVNSSSGHCYLELVEKGGANGIPKARVSATVWRHVYGMLSSYFCAATGEDLRAGMKVLFRAGITYHELYGLSLNITDIDPMYTLGDMERQRQETIARLREDGVLDLNRELELPELIRRIALVSSPNAAGYEDFMNELGASPYGYDVVLFKAVMQGAGAENSIISALSRILDDAEEFDAVVIIRGGGSQSDLSFLNSYLLNYHIAQFPLPVIAGLGHDKDQSILDMVAAVSLKTPTAVAGFLVQRTAAAEYELSLLEDRLKAAAQESVRGNEEMLSVLARALSRYSDKLAHRVEFRLRSLEDDLRRAVGYGLTRCGESLSFMEASLAERSRTKLKSETLRLSTLEILSESRDPQNILALGFSIVRHEGKVLRNASLAGPGEHLDITLASGSLEASVRAARKE